MQITRRTLMSSGAALGAVTLGGCPANTDPVAAWNSFIDGVTQLVAKGCSIEQGFVPTATTILNIVNIIFPGIGTAVVAIAGSVQTVANAICASVTPSPTLAAAIEKATPTEPVHIGDFKLGNKTTEIRGYNAKYGSDKTTATMLSQHGFK